ncbi:hypothetical protein ACIA8O_18980 [Kitasatospora sp. NPDC051853]|uniref:hypothetical protein n=1 Tax=Kitasatospora sp. NPDC051853 TaxID=3364058 RepID=UPI0037B8D44A
MLTVEDLMASADVAEDSYLRKLPVIASGTRVWSTDRFGYIDIAYQTDRRSCFYEQKTMDAPFKPPAPYQDAHWEADWQYGHVADSEWERGKRQVLADDTCRLTDGPNGSREALWCGADGLFVRRGTMMFGFRMMLGLLRADGEPSSLTHSELAAWRLAERVLDRFDHGVYPSSPPTDGPAYGKNVLIALPYSGARPAVTGTALVADTCPAMRPDSAGGAAVRVPQDVTLPDGVTLPRGWVVYGVAVPGESPEVVYLAGFGAPCAVLGSGVFIGEPNLRRMVVAFLPPRTGPERAAKTICGADDPVAAALLVRRLGLPDCPPANPVADTVVRTIDTGDPDLVVTVTRTRVRSSSDVEVDTYVLKTYVVDTGRRTVDLQSVHCGNGSDLRASCQGTFGLFLLKGSRLGTRLGADRYSTLLSNLAAAMAD